MTRDEHTLRFRRFQTSRENFFTPKINAALYKQYQQFIKYVDIFGLGSIAKIDSSGIEHVIRNLYMDAGTVYGAKIRADFVKEGATFIQHGKQLKARGAIGFSEHMAQLIADYFRTDILNVSEGITQTTRDLITKIFTEATQIGLSINEIVDQLKDTELSRVRARLIARTETTTATNQSAHFVAKDTGLLVKKTWLATNDKRTRDDHRDVNGNTVGRDDYFIVGSSTMLVPGARVQQNGQAVPASELCNCRCSVTYATVRDRNGRLVRA